MQRRVKAIVAGACAASMALAAAGCAPEGAVDPSELVPFDPSDEIVEAVYGPPPEYEYIPVFDGPGAYTYDPSSNQNEDVYGPPPDEIESLDAVGVEGDGVVYADDEGNRYQVMDDPYGGE